MNDKIVNISFNIWANDENEGMELKKMICEFIDWHGSKGRKVTASGLIDAMKKMRESTLAMSIVNKHFK
jgi:hypothetical protein